MAAILKFKMDAITKSSNSIANAFNGYLDPENMDIDTKIKYMCASHTEIWAKHDLIGGHFEIQDGGRLPCRRRWVTSFILIYIP
jgi:hypothetical protein